MKPYEESVADDVWAERPGQIKNKQGRWERDMLEKLAFASLKEQRRARRWRIFFLFLFASYIAFITWKAMGGSVSGPSKVEEHTAFVRVHGTIVEGQDASARYLVPALRKAFEAEDAKAVVLAINSPGGSPVQAGIIHDEILRLKEKHKKSIYAVISDIGASGGYYVAVAADRIYVDKASIVGSIGVLMNGFGFTETMEKLGVERRLLSAGDHKGFLDPFSPENQDDVLHAKKMLRQIHQQFIAVVRAGRGSRLKETPDMFSGLVWTGEEAIALGLADQLGSMYAVARDVVQHERLVDYSPHKSWVDKVAARLGVSVGAGVVSGAMQEARAPAARLQ